MTWHPHITVATIVEDNGRFLMVEELKGGRRLQGILYAAILLLFIFFMFKQMQVVGIPRRIAAFCLPVVVAVAYALFYSGIAA